MGTRQQAKYPGGKVDLNYLIHGALERQIDCTAAAAAAAAKYTFRPTYLQPFLLTFGPVYWKAREILRQWRWHESMRAGRQVCVCVCVRVCVCVCVLYVCMYVCMYVCACVHDARAPEFLTYVGQDVEVRLEERVSFGHTRKHEDNHLPTQHRTTYQYGNATHHAAVRKNEQKLHRRA